MRKTILFFALPLLASCTGTWDEHYDVTTRTDKTLWEVISSRNDLNSFAQLLEKDGYDKYLDATQRFTVWAPAGTVSTTSAAGKAMTDEEILTQVTENHIARSVVSLSSAGYDTITVLNGKRMPYGSSYFNNATVTEKNIECTNGILHILESQAKFNHNVWTYLRQDAELNDVCDYLYSFNYYEFDPDQSTLGGVVGGQKYYTDSVFVVNNELWSQIGNLSDENKNYIFLAPENSVWNEAIEEFRSFFNYKDAENEGLSDEYAKKALVNRLAYDTSNKEDMANLKDINLEGTEVVECSNGMIYKTDEQVFDPYKIVVDDIIVEAEQESKYQTAKNNCSDDDKAVAVTKAGISVSNNYFMCFTPSSAILKPTVTYALPNVLSAKYDIGVVMVPINLTANGYSSSIEQKKAKLSFELTDKQTGADIKVDNVIYEGTGIDTIWVVKDYEFEYCDYFPEQTSWNENANVKLKITNNVKRSETSEYTRYMYIDCIVLKPKRD